MHPALQSWMHDDFGKEKKLSIKKYYGKRVIFLGIEDYMRITSMYPRWMFNNIKYRDKEFLEKGLLHFHCPKRDVTFLLALNLNDWFEKDKFEKGYWEEIKINIDAYPFSTQELCEMLEKQEA